MAMTDADLAAHLSDPQERATARALAEGSAKPQTRLPRVLRPLVVLHGLAFRDLAHDRPETGPALLTALRLGLLGR